MLTIQPNSLRRPARSHLLQAASIVLLLLGSHLLVAQDRVITGRVTGSDDGQALVGVNVVVRGTSRGTVTDSNGNYNIQLGENEKTLTFSFVGFVQQELAVEANKTLDVSLRADVVQLSELVISGVGIPTEKRKLAFALETVSAKELPVTPTASIDQALIGRIPGAQISSVNGIPGAEVSIVLRGINTINRDVQPIIVVDGVQMAATQFNALDPSTIDRVEVVQGAASASMYGAQGANGVIQVFTKRGKTGKMKVDISMNAGVNEFLNVGGLRKSRYHAFRTNYKNEITLNDTTKLLELDSTTLRYSGPPSHDLDSATSKYDKLYDQNLKYRDHLSEFMRPAPFRAVNTNFSGGGEKMDYSIGLSNMRQESTFGTGNYNERTNAAINLGAEIVKGLQLRSVTQLIYNRSNLIGQERPDFVARNGTFSLLLNTQPFVDFSMKDIDGNYGFFYGDAAGINSRNPNYVQQYTTALDNKVDILQNFSLQYKFPKYVDVELLYGINHNNRDFRYEIRNQSLNRNVVASNYFWGVLRWNNYDDDTGEITSNYNKQTFQNFKASATARLDLEKDLQLKIPLRSTTQFAYDYRSDRLSRVEFYALGMPVMPPASSIQGTHFSMYWDHKSEFVTYGYLLNQRLEYGELAGVSGGFRSDYSSAFGKGSKPFTFPRGDIYFRVSGMDFWNNSGLSKQVLEWKLRAAYGQAGIQPQPYDRYVTLGSRPVGSSNVLFIPSVQANPELDVEVSTEFEAGTDIYLEGMKGDWLGGIEFSFTYWTRETDNGIWEAVAPPSAAVQRRKANLIGLQSNGTQASLKANILKGRKATWNLTVNYSRQQSNISRIEGEQLIYFNRVLKEGSPVAEFFGNKMLHQVDERKPDGTPFIPDSVQFAYEVASNGWVVNSTTKQPYISSDRHIIGSPNPDFIWSFINDFSFRSFLTASIQFDGMIGNEMYNQTRQWMYRDGIHSDYEKPLAMKEDTAAWSAFYHGTYNVNQKNNYFVEDASFIRLRTASVGVDFARLFNMGAIARLQLVLTGRNLWTLTNYSGMDPEVSTYSVPNSVYDPRLQALERGVDDMTIPNSRSYQVTLNIGF